MSLASGVGRPTNWCVHTPERGGIRPHSAANEEDALMEGPPIERRRFLNWFVGTSVGAMCVSVLYPVLRSVSPPNVPEAATNQVEAGAVNDPVFLDKGYKIVR